MPTSVLGAERHTALLRHGHEGYERHTPLGRLESSFVDGCGDFHASRDSCANTKAFSKRRCGELCECVVSDAGINFGA